MWQYIMITVIVLIPLLGVCLGKSWAAPVLGGIVIPLLMLNSQLKTIYIVKDCGVVEIKPGWGNKICVNEISRISYSPKAMGMQKVKIEHNQGFVMVNPDKPLEFVEALRKIYPALSVEGFELIKNN